MATEEHRPARSGCLAAILFVTTLVVLDEFGLCIAIASPAGFGPLLAALGLLSFIGGAALGAYRAKKTVPPTRWTPYYWIIHGLAGLAIPVLIAHCLLFR